MPQLHHSESVINILHASFLLFNDYIHQIKSKNKPGKIIIIIRIRIITKTIIITVVVVVVVIVVLFSARLSI